MDPSDTRSPDVIALFDVDGTLTKPRLVSVQLRSHKPSGLLVILYQFNSRALKLCRD